MHIIRRAALAVLVGAALSGRLVTASAADREHRADDEERAKKEDDD